MFSSLLRVPAGTLISTPTHLVYRHYGIVTEHGMVISNSARCGGVAEETLAAFCNGKIWRIEPRPSDLPWWIVLARARSEIGRPYDLFSWNCESFYTNCYGLRPHSHQVTVSVLIAALAVLTGISASGS